MLSTSQLSQAAPAVVAVLVVCVWLVRHLHKPPYPPGPKPAPFFGHIFQVPKTHTWRYFASLAKSYGSVVRLTLAGDDILVLNSSKDAEELLGRRSSNYSSRKQIIYAGKYLSGGKRLVLAPYGEEMKKQRTAFHMMLQPRALGSYEGIQDLESIRLLRNLLMHPERLESNTKRFAASIVFSLSYGRRLPDDDKDLETVENLLENFIHDCYPGAHLVDTFPILDKLPDLLAPWRAEALKKHDQELQFFSRLIREARENRSEKDSLTTDCFAVRLWEEKDKLGLDMETMCYICGEAFEAGTDSTAATMMWFIFAMASYQNVFKRAQEELDSVVGGKPHMIPDFEHFAMLPYCAALCKEVLRYFPATPGCFPHLSNTADEYNGYRINAKTMVIPNTWAIHRNEDEYPDANVFNPDRFLRTDTEINSASLAEGHYGFGFGRRACPGKYLATRTIWLGLVRLIWAFDIRPASDPAGRPYVLNPEDCTSGITTKPKDLRIVITPRSIEHSETIMQTWGKLSQ